MKKPTTKKKATRRMSPQNPIQQQTFTLLMARFDTIEKQNKEQLEFLQKHIELDNKVHDVVNRHTGYWNIAKWFVAPAGGVGLIITIIAYFIH